MPNKPNRIPRVKPGHGLIIKKSTGAFTKTASNILAVKLTNAQKKAAKAAKKREEDFNFSGSDSGGETDKRIELERKRFAIQLEETEKARQATAKNKMVEYEEKLLISAKVKQSMASSKPVAAPAKDIILRLNK